MQKYCHNVRIGKLPSDHTMMPHRTLHLCRELFENVLHRLSQKYCTPLPYISKYCYYSMYHCTTARRRPEKRHL